MNKSFRSLASHYGMMDEEGVTIEAEVEPTGEGVDAAAVEVDEAADAIQAEDKAIQELVEAHEGLTEVAEAIEESGEAGGLSQESARMARIAIARMVGHIPGYLPDTFMSMESFGSTNGRTRATALSLEGVKDMIIDFWKMIWAKIQKLYASIKNWFQKVLGAAPRLKKKAEALAAAASKRTGTATEKKINFSDAKHLAIGGKPAAAGQVITGIEGLINTGKAVLGAKGDDLTKFIDTIVSGLENSSDASKVTAAEGALKDVASKIASAAGATHAASGNRAGAGGEAKISAELLGGKAFLVVVGSGSLREASRSFNASVTSHGDKVKEVASDEMATLSLSEIAKIGDLVADLADVVTGYEKLWQERGKETDRLDAAVKKSVAGAEKAEGEEKAKVAGAKDLASAGGNTWRKQVAFESSTVNFLLSAGRAALIYGEKSLSQYKGA